MNLSDLRVFLAVADEESLVAAASRLHLTPSAVSKAIRRLEDSLDIELFDRSARTLVLNTSGARLVGRARELLSLAEQARADIQGRDADAECRIAGPAVLLWRDGPRVAAALSDHVRATLRFSAMFEEEALDALANGEAGVAIVTSAVLDGKGREWSPDWDKLALGPMVLALAAGASHPLAARGGGAGQACQATLDDVLSYPFVCPTRSLFCGERRGTRSDGWRDDAFPRTIRYWTDDLQLLLAFVRSGEALAYLPEFALAESGMVRIDVAGNHAGCSEEAWMVWNRRTAPAWLATLAGRLGKAGQDGAIPTA